MTMLAKKRRLDALLKDAVPILSGCLNPNMIKIDGSINKTLIEKAHVNNF